MNRYLLECNLGTFIIVLEGKIEEYYLIDVNCSYKIIPQAINREKNKLEIVTTSFMDLSLQEKLILQIEGEKILCKGCLADYGEVNSYAVRYEGLTPYEEMMTEISTKKKKKYKRLTEEEIEFKVEQLLANMTLKEKIGQMSQSSGEDVSEIGEKIEGKPMLQQIDDGEVGSVIYIGCSPETVFSYQKHAVENTRLGIPLLICQDVIHGFQTIAPIPLAQSCSFDIELIKKTARMAAKEAASAGIMCAYAPMLDLSRDPRWGRVSEGAGEDPYLAGEIAEAIVKGYQGEHLDDLDSVAACLKHFVGYSACEGGRDYNTTEISDYSLFNMYVPAFKKGIDAGAAMVMSAFTFLNGRPVTANKKILKSLLRDKLNFEGIVITDYAAVKEVGIHGCGKDWSDVTRQVIDAGVDVEMATSYYNSYLEELVNNGLISESQIDDSVRKILSLKYHLGIMDDPYRYVQPEKKETLIYSKEHLQICEKIAEESIVLLKNDRVLPVSKEKTIALVGPFGDEKDMLGTWQFSNYNEQAITIREGLESEGYHVLFAKGCEWNAENPELSKQAIAVSKSADVIIVSLGETSGTTGEAASKSDLNLPKAQIKLLKKLSETGKSIIVTLTNGRPILMNEINEYTDGIVETWFLGSMAGKAIAGVISGRVNPSGKLSMSFPMNMGQIPVYYNHYRTGRPNKGNEDRFTSRYLDGPNEPMYAFGYGLNYGNVKIENALIRTNNRNESEVIVKLVNDSDISCIEVVQMYIGNSFSAYVRPIKELKGFQRVNIGADESVEVSFKIGTEQIAYYTPEGTEMVEPGTYQIMIGLSSRDCDLVKLDFIFS